MYNGLPQKYFDLLPQPTGTLVTMIRRVDVNNNLEEYTVLRVHMHTIHD